MQVLNFIPEDHIRRKLVRKATLLCALLVAAVGVALGIMFVVLGAAEDRLDGRKQEVDQAVAQAADGVQQWQKFLADRQAILEKASRASRLLNPLPRSRVVAEIVRLMPEKASLTELVIAEDTSQTVEAAVTQGPAALRTAAKVQPARGEGGETRIHLLGLAPTDVEVAQLIAALSNSAYFDEVELSFSEDQAFQDRSLRRFEVVFRMSDEASRRALSGGVAKVARAAKEGRR